VATLQFPARLIAPHGVAGHAPPAPATTRLLPAPHFAGRDWRFAAATDGHIAANHRVLHRPNSSAPGAPFAGALVRLHRTADGRLAWQGLSDAQGWYHAAGLEVGASYYPVAIDLAGHYECVAAGPVVAVAAAPP